MDLVNAFHEKLMGMGMGDEEGEEEEGGAGGASPHDIPVELEGQCSKCGVEWAVTSHQLLTAPP